MKIQEIAIISIGMKSSLQIITNKQKKLALQTELYETSEDFIYIRVKRYPVMDDTENLKHKDYTYKLWQSGLMWVSNYQLAPYDNYSNKRKARIDFF